ncbi:MAG: thioredoxin domain-containing protein [Pseudomonadota bacterium]
MNAFLKRRSKDIIFALVLIGGVAVFATSGRTSATDAEYALDREPEVIAATFSSAWCSACKVLEPKLAKVIPGFSDKPVRFVKLNFTFGEAEGHEETAASLNFSDVYERFKGGTGFTLLIDADSGEIIDMLTMEHSKDAMRAAIAQSIAVAGRADAAKAP